MRIKIIVFCGILLFSICIFAEEIVLPRMNQIQVIGTHNSYHKRPEFLSWAVNYSKEVSGWDYEHLPLDVQLENGVRSLEIDVHNTPNGWEVMHVPHFDKESTCSNLKECLGAVREWSDKNPKHVPIIIMIEWKSEGPVIDKNITYPQKQDIERLEEDILSVWQRERIITPDSVRGNCKTLEEAVLTNGWPILDEVRGKVLFIFHNKRELRQMYLEDHPNLEGRAMFVNSVPGEPFAATVIVDNPYREDIPEFVLKGYIVRVLGGDPKHQNIDRVKERDDKAFSCGAQVISTDNPPGEVCGKTGYFVAFPDGSTVRWNSLNSPINTSEPPEPYPQTRQAMMKTK